MRILIHGLGVPTKSMKIEPPHFINDSKKLLFVTNEKSGSQIKRYEMLIIQKWYWIINFPMMTTFELPGTNIQEQSLNKLMASSFVREHPKY